MREIRFLLFVGFQWTRQLIPDELAGLFLCDVDSRKRHRTNFTDTIQMNFSIIHITYIFSRASLFFYLMFLFFFEPQPSRFQRIKIFESPPALWQTSLPWGHGLNEYERRYIYPQTSFRQLSVAQVEHGHHRQRECDNSREALHCGRFIRRYGSSIKYAGTGSN